MKFGAKVRRLHSEVGWGEGRGLFSFLNKGRG